MITRTRRLASVPLIAAALTLAVSGCGGGSGGEAPGTGAATSAAPTGSSGAPTTSAPDSAAPSGTAVTGDGTAVPALAACTADMLTGAVEDTAGGGAAGSVYRTLVLTNSSDTACTTAGFPGVSYLDPSGGQVGAPATRTEAEPVPVVLQPGQSAAAELRETRAENYGEACQPQETAALLVYPPEDTTALQVPHASLGCAGEEIELLSVGVLAAR